jgi:hypothetical protein
MMPYIKKIDRASYDDIVDSLADKVKYNGEADAKQYCGDLNYIITTLLHKVLDDGVRTGYADYNELIGMLECCKLELYRRKVAPYEDEKIKENGDV